MPHPDPSDRNTMKAGVLKRFLMKPPKACTIKRRALKRFVEKWCHDNLTPLSVDTDLSVETWLSQTNYPAWRKDQLLRKYKAIINPREKKYGLVKSFMKDECYPEYKHARAINSRTDEFKTLVGPTFKAIEKEVFKLDWFIKKIPVKDRPKYIMDRLGHGRRFMASDYTAYESHFDKETMDCIEFVLYDYMTQNLPNREEFKYLVGQVIGGLNVCIFKFFSVEVEATRMSGEMCTSLGNGFSNLMLMLFLCDLKGCTGVRGVVEGDDGLFTLDGPCPTAEDFAEIGFTIKVEMHDRISDASFCGLLFDPEDLVIVTNPLEELATFGWTTSQYRKSSTKRLKELLKCKSISLAYQYGGCPILTSLARYGLRMTAEVKARPGRMNQWEADQFFEAKLYSKGVLREVPLRTRLLVERLYGISMETQIKVENYLDGLTTLQPLNIPDLEIMIPQHWKHYWFFYVSDLNKSFPSEDIAPAPPR